MQPIGSGKMLPPLASQTSEMRETYNHKRRLETWRPTGRLRQEDLDNRDAALRRQLNRPIPCSFTGRTEEPTFLDQPEKIHSAQQRSSGSCRWRCGAGRDLGRDRIRRALRPIVSAGRRPARCHDGRGCKRTFINILLAQSSPARQTGARKKGCDELHDAHIREISDFDQGGPYWPSGRAPARPLSSPAA